MSGFRTTCRADWRSLSRAARLLILNGFAFNIGFYMLMPFLANHLGGSLGLAGWASGLVLGMRVFSQQGLFLLGGMLGDRLGYRPAILWGCLIRSIGFVCLAWASHLWVLLLAAFLTGFAGALFTPCAQAYLASECQSDTQRQSAFSLHNLASEAGMLLGPLIGLLLTQLSFLLTGLVAGGVFFALSWAQWRLLPADVIPISRTAVSPSSQWRELIRNRTFLYFCLLATAYQLLFHQLYLAVPAFIFGNHLPRHWLTIIFTVSAAIGVLLQLPASRLVSRYLSTASGMGLGLGMMGGSYLAFLLLPHWPSVALLAQVVLFSIGSILCFPLFAAYLPQFAGTASLGGYYGFYASLGGCVALLSNLFIGYLLGDTFTKPSALVWSLLVIWGGLAGVLIYRLVRQRDNLPSK